MPQKLDAQPVPIWKQPNHINTTSMYIDSPTIFDRDIKAVVISANETTTTSNQRTSHFRLFLELKPTLKKVLSVELNSHTTPNNPTISKLHIHFRNHMGSTATPKMGEKRIPIRTGKFPSVIEVVTLLLQNNRDHYKLDLGTGSGCRYWCETVMDDFGKQGWVDAKAWEEVNRLAMELKANEKWKNVDIPFPSPQGIFYKTVLEDFGNRGGIDGRALEDVNNLAVPELNINEKWKEVGTPSAPPPGTRGADDLSQQQSSMIN